MKKKLFFAAIIFLAAAAVFFARKKENKPDSSAEVKDSVPNNPKFTTLSISATFFTDMEEPNPATWVGEKNTEQHFSGKFSNKLSDKVEYGITFSKKGNEIPSHEKVKQARISLQAFSKEPLKKASLVYAVIGTTEKTIEYFQQAIQGETNKWSNNEFIVPVNSSGWGHDAMVKIYIWNEGKEFFYIDDIKIEFFSEEEKHAGAELTPKQNFIYDFEPVADVSSPINLSNAFAHSGNYSMEMSGSDTYSESIIRKFSAVSSKSLTFISTSAWIYPKDDDPVVALVVAIENKEGKSISWQGKATDNMHLKKNKWHKINFRADLRELKLSPEDVSKVYIWNKKGGTVYVDDLEIVYGDVPKPTGSAPGVYVNLTGEITQLPGKNKPPFVHTQFSEIPFFHPTSIFLVDEGGKKEGALSPESPILNGNFCGHDNEQDDIFIASQNSWSVYSWCESSKKFVSVLTEAAEVSLAGKIAMSGYFEDPAQDEILLIDTMAKVLFQTIRFGRLENSCEAPIEKIKSQRFSFEIPGMNLKGNNWNIIPGNYRGDSRQEILFVSSDGQWKMIEKVKEGFEVSGNGNLGRGTVLSIHLITSASGHDKALLFSEKNKKLDYCFLDFSAGSSTCSQNELKDKSFLNQFNMQSTFYSGRFDNSNKSLLFYFDNEWRFDLKKLRIDTDGLTIESQVDFKQTDPERNPCYYEYTKIISGNFFGTGIDGFLVMMRNCRDENFDGKRCLEYEEVKGMPSGYLFYQYKNAD